MSEKQVKVRIAMDGGKAVEAQLEGIGQKGKASMQAIGQSSGAMRANVQNASYQVQDFFVQVASGTDASRALAQQLPQLLGSLGLFGVLAGTAAAILIPLGSAIFGMGEEAETAEKQIKTLNEAVSALKQATSAANSSPTDLFAQYGMGAEKAKEVLEIERQIAKIRAERALTSVGKTIGAMGFSGEKLPDLDALQVEYAQLSAAIQGFREVQSSADQEELDSLRLRQDAVRRMTEAYINGADVYTERLTGIADAIGMAFEGNEEAIERVNAAMIELAAAKGVDDVAAKASNLRQALFEASDGGRLLNEEGAKLLEGLTDAELAALALAQVDMASGISNASAEAVALAQNLGIALDAAQRLAALGPQGINTNPDPSGQVYSGRGGDPRTMGGSALDWQVRAADEFLRNWKPPKAAGAKGGGGVSDEQKARNDMLREAQRLYEQTRTDAEKYTAEVANLDAMLKAGVIDQDLYNRGLARAAEQYGEATGAAAFFREMNIDIKETLIDVALEGGSALDGLIEKLKRAAVEAALFGSGPIAKLFGMSGGGLFGDLFAAPLAGSKASGGPVERGRAYRVGEMGPEIFMPNANGTILPIDPMSERRMPQGATTAAAAAQPVRLEVSLGDGLVARILDQAQAQAVRVVQKSLTAYDSQVLPARMQQISADPRRKG